VDDAASPAERLPTKEIDMTSTTDDIDTDRRLKAAHRAMWALGDYPTLATELIAPLGTALVEACDIRPGDRVLDVGAGAGNAAIPAALAGAHVVASDLTPELFETGRRKAAAHGVDVQWQDGDAEALPYPDASFDVLLSCVGVMVAPHHEAAARELTRVCRPGGTIGLLNWTPDGFIGRLFATMKPFAPAPPPGSQPAPLWGDEAHVRSLLGDAVQDVRTTRTTLPVTRFATPEAFRDYFKTMYGPTIAVYRANAADPEKVAALDAALADLARSNDVGTDGHTRMEWEYLLFTARRTTS
jgi:ubiquinone/menaquinone biosynthesis C-methylase UbiE